jgi:hypothetical protein
VIEVSGDLWGRIRLFCSKTSLATHWGPDSTKYVDQFQFAHLLRSQQLDADDFRVLDVVRKCRVS